jgi:hypothetical protein
MITNCKDYILRGSLPKKEKGSDSENEDESDEDAGSDEKAL